MGLSPMKRAFFLLHDSFEALHKVVGLGLCETERRQKSQDIRGSGSGEHMLLADEARAEFLDGFGKFNAYHQAFTAHVGYGRSHFCQGLELLHEVTTHLGSILHKTFILHDIKHSQCCGASQVITAKGGTELAVAGLKVGRDEHSTHRETIGYALGTGNHIGLYVQMLMRKEAAAATIAALDFVADEDGAVFVANRTESLEELCRRHTDATHALNTLHYDGGYIAFTQLCFKGGKVVERQEGNVIVGIDGSYNLGIVRCFYGERSATVESLRRGQDTTAPCMERSQFQGILIGFCAGIDEEELIIFITASLAEAFGQLLLQTVDNGVGIKSELAKLGIKGGHIMGMTVTDTDDGVTAIKVKIFLTGAVPDVTAFAFNDVYVEEGIYGVEGHFLVGS